MKFFFHDSNKHHARHTEKAQMNWRAASGDGYSYLVT